MSQGNQSQSDEDGDLAEYHVDLQDKLYDEEISKQSSQKKCRGRPKMPEKWTRVISINYDALDKLKSYQLNTDLLLAAGVP